MVIFYGCKNFGSVEKNGSMINSFLNAVEELGIKPSLEIFDKPSDFIKYKIRSPGAVIINGEVVFRGHYNLSGSIRKAVRREAEREGLV